jgi:hypothetical protein
MKRILIQWLILSLPATLLGQGQVNFLNTAATPIRTNGMNISGLNTFRIGLYTAPAGTVNESLFTLIAVATNSSLVPGRIGSGGGLIDVTGNNGTPIAYQVRVWSLGLGASYEAAVASGGQQGWWLGKSSIGQVTPAVGGAPVPSLFSSTAGMPEFPGQLASGIDMPIIPEPSAFVLAALCILVGFGAGRRPMGTQRKL